MKHETGKEHLAERGNPIMIKPSLECSSFGEHAKRLIKSRERLDKHSL